MKTTMTLAANLNCSIFDVMDRDVAEVITTINFFIALGDEQENETPVATKKTKADKEKRIRVNDATATGGWF